MNAIITAVLTLLQAALPLAGGNSSAISKIVQALIVIVPVVTQEVADLLPEVQGIIKALMSTDGVSDDDMAALAALDQQCDDAFEAAAAAKGM